MSDAHPSRGDITAAAEVGRLGRELELLRETWIWIDLLRHKAHALHATPPGPVDPGELARSLAARGPFQQPPTSAEPAPGVDEDGEELLRQAQSMWDTVANPTDPDACHELAERANRLADRLELHWQAARSQLFGADELGRMLAPPTRGESV